MFDVFAWFNPRSCESSAAGGILCLQGANTYATDTIIKIVVTFVVVGPGDGCAPGVPPME